MIKSAKQIMTSKKFLKLNSLPVMNNFVITFLLGALRVFLEAEISSSVLQNNKLTEKLNYGF